MAVHETQSVLIHSSQPLTFSAGSTYRFTRTAGDEAIVVDRSDAGQTTATVLGDKPVEVWAQDDVLLSTSGSTKVTVTRAEEGLELDGEAKKSKQQQEFESKLDKKKK